jgi:hypothetical protein
MPLPISESDTSSPLSLSSENISGPCAIINHFSSAGLRRAASFGVLPKWAVCPLPAPTHLRDIPGFQASLQAKQEPTCPLERKCTWQPSSRSCARMPIKPSDWRVLCSTALQPAQPEIAWNSAGRARQGHPQTGYNIPVEARILNRQRGNRTRPEHTASIQQYWNLLREENTFCARLRGW